MKKNTAKMLKAISFGVSLYLILFLLLIFQQISNDLFLLSFGLLSCLFLLIVLLSYWQHNRSLIHLENKLEEMANNNHSVKINYLGHKFQNIYRSIEEIDSKLQYYYTKVSKQKEGFNTIIETIKEAIWIQDEKGIIKTYNSSFAAIIRKDDIKHQYFWNVIRDKSLYDIVDRIYKDPRSLIEEIGFDDKHYLCSTSYSKHNKEIVFILYDITQFRQLETIKKDFIMNVSHELRTPLTSIKGYLETMYDEEFDSETSMYLNVIKRNTDRLIYIVNDLLTLSKLEAEKVLDLERIPIIEFLENIFKIFSQRLEKKNLKLIFNNRSKIKYCTADRYMLEQVFINLIDNAVKYTNEGEIKITMQDKDSALIFHIADNGSGIAEEHLPRLFERFYTVDKSRSRKLGGTGLGLSIVKHIVNQHNGTIEVMSETGKGTEFIINLPLQNE